MGILSALSGKVYHFNTINTPINNDLNSRIKNLEKSIEQIYLLACFDVSQKIIFGMFDPDNGMFAKQIKTLTEKSLKSIWFILMLACVEHAILDREKDNIFGQNMIDKLADIFEQSPAKIHSLIEIGNMKEIDDLFFIEIWHQICNVIEENPENKINSTALTIAFIDLYGTYIKIAQDISNEYFSKS